MMYPSSRKLSGLTQSRVLLAFLLLCAALLAAGSIVQGEGGSRSAQSVAGQDAARSAVPADPARLAQARDLATKGKLAYEQAHFDEAQNYYTQAQKLDPSSAEIKGILADTASNLEHQQALRQSLAMSGQKEADAVKERYARATDLMKQEKYSQARNEFYQVWLLAGDYSSTRKNLARIADLTATQPAPAKEQPAALPAGPALQMAAESAPPAVSERDAKLQGAHEAALAKQQVEAALTDARNLLKAGEVDQAEAAYNDVLKMSTDNKDAQKGLKRIEEARAAAGNAERERQVAEREAGIKQQLADAAVAVKASDLAQAENLYKAVLTTDPENKKAVKGLAGLTGTRAEQERLAQTKKDEEARLATEAQAKAAQGEIGKSLADAAAALKRQEFDEAARLYQAVLASDENNPAAKKGADRVEAARLLAKVDQDRSAQDKERADREARIKQGVVDADALRLDGKFDEALKALDDAKSLDAENKSVTRLEAKIQKDRDAAAKKAQDEADKLAKAEAGQKAKDEAAKIAQTDAEQKAQAAADKKAKDEADKLALAEADQKAKDATKVVAQARPKAGDSLPAISQAQVAAPFEVTSAEAPWTEIKPAGETPNPQPAPEVVPLPAFERADPTPALEKAAPAPAPPPVPEKTAPLNPEDAKAVKALMTQAKSFYDQKDVAKAREVWQQVIAKDPGNKTAQTYLEETAEEYERLLADQTKQKSTGEIERLGMEKLKRPVTISTVESTPLVDFLDNLRFPSGLNFVVADGKEAMVDCSYVDKSTEEILNSLLPPMGLKWVRMTGDVIQVTADLKSRVFHLPPEQMSKVKTLLETKTLQRIIYGDDAKPLKSTQLVLDEREGILMAVDSQDHLNKLDTFLTSMKTDASVELVTRIYTIKEKDGPEIKALVDAVVHSKKTPFDLERSVLLAGKNLIVKETTDNLIKIEELLNDRLLLKGLSSGSLQVEVFDILPATALAQAPGQAADFFESTKEVIETFLYAEEGKAKAADQGRRMWADPPNFQITVTDYPDRLRRVADYLGSLRQIQQEKRQEVITVKHQPSDVMATNLQTILGVSGGAGAGATGLGGPSAPGTQQRTFQLTEPQNPVTFMGLEVRLRRVNLTGGGGVGGGGNLNNASCDLTVRTNTQSTNITLNIFESQFVDNFELFAQDIRFGGGRAGGRVTLVIRFIPPDVAVAPGAVANQGLPGPAVIPPTAGVIPPEITSFPGTNALIIRYEDPADLATIRDLIDQLDKTTPQAEIETKFVTVNEERAKEFSAQFSFLDRSDPRNIGTGIIDVVNSPAAGLVPISGGSIGTIAKNALNGSFNDQTNIEGVMHNFLGKYVDWQMRMLEVEGVASITNGPHITVQNNQTALFQLGNIVTLNTPQLNGNGTSNVVNSNNNTGTNGNNTNNNTGTNNINNGNNNNTGNSVTGNNAANGNLNGSNVTSATRQGYVGGQQSRGVMNQVSLDILSIQILSDESIILEMQLDISEAPNWIARNLWNDASNGLAGVNGASPTQVPGPSGSRPGYGTFDRPYVGSPATENKSLHTIAAVRSGGTIVLGGWMGETNEDLTGGTPGLRNLPWVGKLFFSHNVHTRMRTNLLIFLSATIIQ